MVGLRLGGNPIIDYASDFWLVSTPDGNRVGYITSPWWSPELDTNIALAWVPVEHSEVGTKLLADLPEPYAIKPGDPVAAEVSAMPFRPSVNPCAREVATKKGRDYAD
jgi:glycine cleavage system aminomethyltransferase T